MANTVGNGRINRVFGDITTGAEIIIICAVFCQRTALHFHFVSSLPSATHHFADSAHSLGVGGNHREGAKVMQNIFSGNGFLANAGIGKGHVFGNIGIKVMTDHEHIQMLVHSVHRIGPRRIGR